MTTAGPRTISQLVGTPMSPRASSLRRWVSVMRSPRRTMISPRRMRTRTGSTASSASRRRGWVKARSRTRLARSAAWPTALATANARPVSPEARRSSRRCSRASSSCSIRTPTPITRSTVARVVARACTNPTGADGGAVGVFPVDGFDAAGGDAEADRRLLRIDVIDGAGRLNVLLRHVSGPQHLPLRHVRQGGDHQEGQEGDQPDEALRDPREREEWGQATPGPGEDNHLLFPV